MPRQSILNGYYSRALYAEVGKARRSDEMTSVYHRHSTSSVITIRLSGSPSDNGIAFVVPGGNMG